MSPDNFDPLFKELEPPPFGFARLRARLARRRRRRVVFAATTVAVAVALAILIGVSSVPQRSIVVVAAAPAAVPNAPPVPLPANPALVGLGLVQRPTEPVTLLSSTQNTALSPVLTSGPVLIYTVAGL